MHLLAGRRIGTHGGDHVFQQHDRGTRFNADATTGRILHVPFGGSGDHDVFGFRIEESVLHGGQAGQMGHVFVSVSSGDPLKGHGGFQSRQRNLAELLALAMSAASCPLAFAIRYASSWPLGSRAIFIDNTPLASICTPAAPRMLPLLLVLLFVLLLLLT